MSGCIGQQFNLVMSAGNDFVIDHYNCANGYFVCFIGKHGFFEGLLHEVGVVII